MTEFYGKMILFFSIDEIYAFLSVSGTVTSVVCRCFFFLSIFTTLIGI